MKFPPIYRIFLNCFFIISNFGFGADTPIDINQQMLDEIVKESHLTPEQKKIVICENFANEHISPSKRTDSNGNQIAHVKFIIQYYKVPLAKIIEHKVEALLNPRIREALVFKDNNGHEYVKWPIYPEDRINHTFMVKHLKFFGLNGADCQPVSDNPDDPNGLDAYFTASRSMLFRSRKNGVVFTVKVSTNFVGGKEQNLASKEIKGEEAFKNILVTKFVQDILPHANLKHLILWKETLGFSMNSPYYLSKGMIIRDLEDLGTTSEQLIKTPAHFSYIPGFSCVQDKNLPLLKELAAKALGKSGPEVISDDDLNNFAINSYALPVARAMAELLFHCGIQMSSVHGQNVLLQLDARGIPTGKIVVRDFTDSSLITMFAPKNNPFLQDVINHQCFIRTCESDSFPVSYLTDVTMFPSGPRWFRKWVGEEHVLTLYYQAFDAVFSQLSGIPINHLGLLEGRDTNRYSIKAGYIKQ